MARVTTETHDLGWEHDRHTTLQICTMSTTLFDPGCVGILCQMRAASKTEKETKTEVKCKFNYPRTKRQYTTIEPELIRTRDKSLRYKNNLHLRGVYTLDAHLTQFSKYNATFPCRFVSTCRLYYHKCKQIVQYSVHAPASLVINKSLVRVLHCFAS